MNRPHASSLLTSRGKPYALPRLVLGNPTPASDEEARFAVDERYRSARAAGQRQQPIWHEPEPDTWAIIGKLLSELGLRDWLLLVFIAGAAVGVVRVLWGL